MASTGAILVQYVVVRSDLLNVLKWPVGAVITQACHASSAVLHRFYTDPNTQAYLSDVDRMHKVVLQVMELLFVLKSETVLCIEFRLGFEVREALPRDVTSVSTSWSQDPLRPRPPSRLGPIGKCLGLGLGIKGLGRGIGLGKLGLVHKSFFSHICFTFLQNAIVWPQP